MVIFALRMRSGGGNWTIFLNFTPVVIVFVKEWFKNVI